MVGWNYNQFIEMVICLSYTTFILSDRPTSFRGALLCSDADIALSNDTPRWQFMKKQMMTALKLQGDGLKNLEVKTLLYGRKMLDTIAEYKGEPFEPGRLINITLSHLMLVLTFGHSSEEDAAAFVCDTDALFEVGKPAGVYLLLDLAPFLRYFVPPIKMAYTTVLNAITYSNSMYDKHIAERRKLYDHPNVEVFIDHFFKLNMMNKPEDTTKRIDETNIRSMAMDMIIGGLPTTSTALTMMLAVLVHHPEIQDAIYKEIYDVIGRREPRMEDKLSMPFTQAVILESLRYHSLSPHPTPHIARCDSMLQGFLIPAGTMIIPNLWALHHDERYWEHPFEFNPNRWLEDGKVVPPDHVKKQRLLPFGAGKRQCPGEAFARNRLFILTTLMLQKFKFEPAEGHPRPIHDPCQYKVSLIMQPERYKLSVKHRY